MVHKVKECDGYGDMSTLSFTDRSEWFGKAFTTKGFFRVILWKSNELGKILEG